MCTPAGGSYCLSKELHVLPQMLLSRMCETPDIRMFVHVFMCICFRGVRIINIQNTI